MRLRRNSALALGAIGLLAIGCDSSGHSAVIEQALKCGVDIRGAVLDVELLGESSTTLGNSGHWTHRVTIAADRFDDVLSQMHRQHDHDEASAPLVSNMDLTIDCRNASHWAFTETGHDGILVLADAEHLALEIVSYW
jgi:hypothetical protein